MPLMVSLLFLFNSSVYASIRLSTKQCLRLPLGNYKRMLDIQLDTEGFPELKALSERRFEHVKKVIEMFYSLVDGDFKNIYNALQEPVRVSIDFEKQYKPLLEELKKRYDELSKKDKEALKLATILHDVGVPWGRAWEHNKRGGIKTRSILQNRGIDQEVIGEVARLIEQHGDFSNLWVDGFPQDLLALSENEFNEVLLINIFDAMGRFTQDLKPNNAVTPDILELYLSFKDTLMDYQNKENFYKDRFRFLLAPAIFKQFHINKNEYKEMESYIEELIPREEQEDFYGNWNSRLRIYVFPLFAQIGKNSIKDFVKFTKLISQIAAVSLKFNPQLKDLIVDTRLDIMAENIDGETKKSYMSKIAELAHSIPEDYEVSKVRSVIRPGYVGNIFGIRIDLTDKSRIIIDAEGLVPKITPFQLYEKLENAIVAKTLVSLDYEVLDSLYSKYKDYFDSHPDLNPMNTELTKDALLRIIRDLFNPFFGRKGFRICDFFSGTEGLPVSLSEKELEKVGHKKGGVLYTYGIDNQRPWTTVSAKGSKGIIRMDVMDLLGPGATIPASCVDFVTVFNPEHLPKEKIIATVDDVAPIVKAAKKILKPGGWIYITPAAPYLNHKNDHYLFEEAFKNYGFVNVEVIPHPGIGLYEDTFRFFRDTAKPNYLIRAQKPFRSLDEKRRELFKISKMLPTAEEVTDAILKDGSLHPKEMNERLETRIFPEGWRDDNTIILKNGLVFCDAVSRTFAYSVYIVNEYAEGNDVMFSSMPYYGCTAALFKGERSGKTVLSYFHLEVKALDLKETLMEVFEKVESLKLNNLHTLIDVMPNHVGKVKDIINNSEYASILDANKKGDIFINGVMYKKNGQDRKTQIFGTKEGLVIIDAGKDTYIILWDDIQLINKDNSKNSIKQFLFKESSMPLAENPSLASNESILNNKGESFEDIWKKMDKHKLTRGVRDPRYDTKDPEEEELMQDYKQMSLDELQDVLVDLIKSKTMKVSTEVLNSKDPLPAFIESLSKDYDEVILHFNRPIRRIETIKNYIRLSKKERTFYKKGERLNQQLLNNYRYKAFLRELRNRWRKPDKSINLLGIIAKPDSADASL